MFATHATYGLIDQKSWDGVFGKAKEKWFAASRYVDALLWALTKEPEEAADFVDILLEQDAQMRAGSSFGGMPKIASLGAKTAAACLETIATYLLEDHELDADQDEKMKHLYAFDYRLALWVDAAIVERAWRCTGSAPSSGDERKIVDYARALSLSNALSKGRWKRLKERSAKAEGFQDVYDEELHRSVSYLAENAYMLRLEKDMVKILGVGAIWRTAAMGVADVWWYRDPEWPDRELDRNAAEWAVNERVAMAEINAAARDAVISYPWYDRLSDD